MRIAINDANILIDLADLDMLDYFTQLEFEFITTDFIIEEIEDETQKSKVANLIRVNKLTVITTKSEEYSKITDIISNHNGISFEDASVWYYSKKYDGILLTGDGNLRRQALKCGIEVRGILFVFDQLVGKKIFSKETAVTKLKELKTLNSRLPLKEVEARIKAWS